jgi:hypothetical protein
MTTLTKTTVIARSEATRQSPDRDARFRELPRCLASNMGPRTPGICHCEKRSDAAIPSRRLRGWRSPRRYAPRDDSQSGSAAGQCATRNDKRGNAKDDDNCGRLTA